MWEGFWRDTTGGTPFGDALQGVPVVSGPYGVNSRGAKIAEALNAKA